MSTISQIFQGWGAASTLNKTKSDEDAAYTGCNTKLVTLNQIGAVGAAKAVFDLMMEAAGKSSYLFYGSLPLCLATPVLISLATTLPHPPKPVQ